MTLRAVSSLAPAFKFLGDQTWATLSSSFPAASYSGYMVRVTDVGANGCYMVSNGTRWQQLQGQAILKGLGAAVSGIANSETIVLQTLLPANVWQVNDTIRVWLNVTKSGTTTDSLACRIRAGTAGTTADTAIYSSSGANLLATSNQSGGFIFDFKLASATSSQRVGDAATNQAGSYTAAVSTAAAAAVTITDASANALYISVSIFSSGVAETVAIQSGQIQHITP